MLFISTFIPKHHDALIFFFYRPNTYTSYDIIEDIHINDIRTHEDKHIADPFVPCRVCNECYIDENGDVD